MRLTITAVFLVSLPHLHLFGREVDDTLVSVADVRRAPNRPTTYASIECFRSNKQQRGASDEGITIALTNPKVSTTPSSNGFTFTYDTSLRLFRLKRVARHAFDPTKPAERSCRLSSCGCHQSLAKSPCRGIRRKRWSDIDG
jgi:hypothetical protein